MSIKYYLENTELTLQQIADHLGKTYAAVQKYSSDNYTKEQRLSRKSNSYRKSKLGKANPMFEKCGDKHHNFVGIVGDAKGYLMVLKPEWYTGRKGSKHVFAHSVVMCEHLGITEIPPKHCVHHCDKNPHNNSIDNLLMMSLAEHTAWHFSVEGATTISKESTAKWLEARRTARAVMI